METFGYVLPETESEAQAVFEELEPASREIVGAVTRRLDVEADTLDMLVTEEVYQTAHEAMFGSLLVVTTGSESAFESWRTQPPYDAFTVTMEGSDNVDNVAWHTAPVADTVIGATYQDEREAAVATLRRIVWGKIYRPLLSPSH